MFSQHGVIVADGDFSDMIKDKQSELNKLLNKSPKGDNTEAELNEEEADTVEGKTVTGELDSVGRS